jgi:hypothetical protein
VAGLDRLTHGNGARQGDDRRAAGVIVDVKTTAGWTSPVSQGGCPTAGDLVVILLTDLPSGGCRWGLGPDDPRRLIFVTAPGGP